MATLPLTESSEFTPKNPKIVSLIQNDSAKNSPIVIPPSPLMKQLGCGTFVTVYKYKRKSNHGKANSPWAVKKARSNARKSIVDRLIHEGNILKTLNHPYIVAFRNISNNQNGDICLSMEVGGKGLDDIIFKHQEDEIPFPSINIMKTAWCVANALMYLHNEKSLLHGDIKSGNILIKGDFSEVKVCDFGVAILLNEDLNGAKNESSKYVGSEPWTSKEILENGTITDKADIFAYGLVIWEMLALDVPHVALMNEEENLDGSFTGNESTDSFTISQAYFNALGTRPPLPDLSYSKDYDPVIDVFLCCTTEDYKHRPNANTVVQSLSSFKEKYDL